MHPAPFYMHHGHFLNGTVHRSDTGIKTNPVSGRDQAYIKLNKHRKGQKVRYLPAKLTPAGVDTFLVYGFEGLTM